MKVTIKGSTLEIDLMELVEHMGAEQRAVMARFLCANEKLFEAVVDALVSGGSYFEDDDEGDWWFSSRSMAALQAKLVPLMPEVTASLVRELIHQRDQAQLLERRTDDWAWRLYRAWPAEHWRARPELPRDYPHTKPPTEDEVRAAMKARGIFDDPAAVPETEEPGDE